MMSPWKAWSQNQKMEDLKPLLKDMKGAVGEMEAVLSVITVPDHAQMEEGIRRLIGAGGKRLRPSLAWLCWRLGGGSDLPIIPLMCMLELMHTASLIHDDVVDAASLRRGVPTISAESGKAIALRSGDYLLGKAMEFLKIYRGTGINEALADVSTQMCMGEFTQMKNLYRIEAQNEQVYEQQIRQKTAYLIAASCYCGGVAGGLSGQEAEALRAYGEGIGIAFQLKDDLLDFNADLAFGKQRGQDIRSGIFTLPMLHAFAAAPDPDLMGLARKRDKTDEEVDRLISYVIETQGIEYTQARIQTVTKEAIDRLSLLPAGIEKKALIRMAESLGERKI